MKERLVVDVLIFLVIGAIVVFAEIKKQNEKKSSGGFGNSSNEEFDLSSLQDYFKPKKTSNKTSADTSGTELSFNESSSPLHQKKQDQNSLRPTSMNKPEASRSSLMEKNIENRFANKPIASEKLIAVDRDNKSSKSDMSNNYYPEEISSNIGDLSFGKEDIVKAFIFSEAMRKYDINRIYERIPEINDAHLSNDEES